MDSRLCTICPRPGEIWCENCEAVIELHAGDPPIHHRAFYCSNLCRIIDAPVHAPFCSYVMDKKVLQKAKRMGAVAQEIFNMYLENTWTHDIDSVKVDDKEGQPIRVNVTAAQGYEAGPRKESKNERLGGGWYFRVPLQQDNQQTAKAAILAHENSIWQLVVMANIVKGLFKDLVNDPATDIKEVNHAPNPDLQRVVHHVSADNDPITLYSLPYPDHEYMGVFEIKLQTGLIVALSLTGAQFAHVHEPVILWERYMAIYGTPDDRTLTRTSNGSAQRQHYKLLDTLEQVSHLHSDKVVLHHFEQLLTRPEVAKQLRVLNLLALAGPITWGRFNKQFISICSIGIAQIVYFLSPASTESNSSPILSLAHPSALQDSVFYAHKRHLRFYDFGGSLAQNFSWDRMKEVIKEKGPSLDVKREARDVLRNRSIMAPWQDGRLLFLPNQVLREDRAGTSWIVDNPHFNSRRRGL